MAWTFVPVLRKGRSPGWSLKRFDTFPVSQWFLSSLANHGDEFVQDSHLFPFSPNNRNLLSSDTLRFSMWSIFGNFYRYLFNRMSISFCVHTVNHYSVIVGKTLGTNPPAAVLSVLAPFSIIWLQINSIHKKSAGTPADFSVFSFFICETFLLLPSYP